MDYYPAVGVSSGRASKSSQTFTKSVNTLISEVSSLMITSTQDNKLNYFRNNVLTWKGIVGGKISK